MIRRRTDLQNSPCASCKSTDNESSQQDIVDYIALSPEEGAVMWGRAVTISSLVIALLSPIMGSFADRGGYRKFFLVFLTLAVLKYLVGSKLFL